jgi:uncharacterized membrane protein YccC
MDVERTIEYILDMQAKAEVRAAKADERMDKAEVRASKADERMDKFDKRLEATRKLVEAGVKILLKSQQDHAEFEKQFAAYKIESKRDSDRQMKEIKEIQRKTDLKLDRLIDFWGKKRTNGHRS